MSMTTVLLVVLVLSVLYLALRIHQLENAVTKLVRIVNKPRQRDRALGREIAELETDLDMLRDLVKQGAASREDFDQADVIPREARPATRGARRNPPDATPAQPERVPGPAAFYEGKALESHRHPACLLDQGPLGERASAR